MFIALTAWLAPLIKSLETFRQTRTFLEGEGRHEYLTLAIGRLLGEVASRVEVAAEHHAKADCGVEIGGERLTGAAPSTRMVLYSAHDTSLIPMMQVPASAHLLVGWQFYYYDKTSLLELGCLNRCVWWIYLYATYRLWVFMTASGRHLLLASQSSFYVKKM